MASSWSRASAGSIATIGKCVRSSRSPSFCCETRCASSIASCRNSWRRPCLWMAMRLKLRGANGSPSTASTRAVTRGGRPDTSHRTRSPGSASFRSLIASSRRSLLLHRRQPEALAFLAHHAKHQLGRALQLLHRMGGIALPALLGSGEDAVADTQRPTPAALDHTKTRRRPIGMPLLRNGEDIPAVVGLDDAQHGDLRNSARFVEGAAGRAVDQPFVGHVLEQRLELDLVLTRESEGARDLSLARRLVGCRDEVEDLLAAGQSGGSFAGHGFSTRTERECSQCSR